MTMRARLLIAAAIAVVALAAVASASHLQIGDIVVAAEGGFAPKALPRHDDAPITLHGGGSISTASGQLPPVLRELTLLFDRHGWVQTTGLALCTKGQAGGDHVAKARAACPQAIVGEGEGASIVKFPEQRCVPASTTYIVPIVIEPIHQGIYGYRTKATIPRIAGGYGVPISGHLKVGKKWIYKGKPYSYVNALCETGKLEAKGEFTFAEGTLLSRICLQALHAAMTAKKIGIFQVRLR
jgi:hypothetical protein